MAASRVPNSNDSTPETRNSSMVSRNALNTRLKFENTSSTRRSPPFGPGVPRAVVAGEGGPLRPTLTAQSSGAGVHRRRVGGLHPGLAERGLEGLRPGAVVLGLLERVGDPLAHLRVLLGVADAVALLGERLADDLEVVRVLGRVAEQDRAVRG